MQIRLSENKENEYRLDRRVVPESTPSPNQKAAANRKIGVVSISRGGGATTIAYALAEFFAERQKRKNKLKKAKGKCVVSFIEVNSAIDLSGFSYDKMGIEQRFAGREFISFSKLISEGKPITGQYNISGGVNWVVNIPGNDRIDAAGYIRLIENLDTPIKICDIVPEGEYNLPVKGTQNLDGFKAMIASMNKIICVIDPLPSKLLAGIPVYEIMRMAESNGIPVVYVVNKMNKGVNMREVKKFLSIKEFYLLETVNSEMIYSSEFECRSILSDEKVHNFITEISAL